MSVVRCYLRKDQNDAYLARVEEIDLGVGELGKQVGDVHQLGPEVKLTNLVKGVHDLDLGKTHQYMFEQDYFHHPNSQKVSDEELGEASRLHYRLTSV
jgi:hypothetical protein